MKLKSGVIVFLIFFIVISVMFQFIDTGMCAYIYKLSPSINPNGYISNRMTTISVSILNILDNTPPSGSVRVRLTSTFLPSPILNDSMYVSGSNIVNFYFKTPSSAGETFTLRFDDDTGQYILPLDIQIVVKLGIYCDVIGESTQSYSVTSAPDIILNVKFRRTTDDLQIDPFIKGCDVTEGGPVTYSPQSGSSTGEYIYNIYLQTKAVGYHSFKIFGEAAGGSSISIPSYIRINVIRPRLYLKIIIGDRPVAYINKDSGMQNVFMSQQTIDIYSLNSKYEDAKGITITKFIAQVEGTTIDILDRVNSGVKELGYHWQFQFVFTKALTTFVIEASLSNYESLSTSFAVSAVSVPDLITQFLFNPLTFVIIGVIIAVVLYKRTKKKPIFTGAVNQ